MKYLADILTVILRMNGFRKNTRVEKNLALSLIFPKLLNHNHRPLSKYL